jgi:hypothetical protein
VDSGAGSRSAEGRSARHITDEHRGRFLLDYMEMLLDEGENEAEGFRHGALVTSKPPRSGFSPHRRALVINKMRAHVVASKGLRNGATAHRD